MYNNNNQGGQAANGQYYQEGYYQQPDQQNPYDQQQYAAQNNQYPNDPNYYNNNNQYYPPPQQQQQQPQPPYNNVNYGNNNINANANNNANMYNANQNSNAFNAENVMNPDFWQNNPTANFGLQFGTQALSAGQSYVNQNINRWISFSMFKYYFKVNNSYVFNKILLLIFPFRNKVWQRVPLRNESNGHMDGFKAPREDLNAPDLYIPVMGFVTYMILEGISQGLRDKFQPDLLGWSGTKALVATILEILYVKLGCYIFSMGTELPLLDMTAYLGYKFVLILTTSTVHLVLSPGGTTAQPYSFFTYLVFIYLSLCLGFFLLRSWRFLMLPTDAAATIVHPMRRRRLYFLFSVAAIQILSSYLLLIS